MLVDVVLVSLALNDARLLYKTDWLGIQNGFRTVDLPLGRRAGLGGCQPGVRQRLNANVTIVSPVPI